MDQKNRTEEFKVKGNELLAKVKELLHEGNIRRISVKAEDGRTLIELPLLLGAAGILLLPQLAAVGIIAALVTRASIVVEKVVED